MKVCMITSSFPRYFGDVWGPWILEYCIQLKNMGCEVFVLCPRTNAIGEKSFEIMKGIEVHRFSYWPWKKWQNLASPPGIIPNLKSFKLTKFQIFPFLFKGWIELFNLVKKKQINLIVSQWVIPSGFLGILAKKITKTPVLISAQGAEFYINNRLMYYFIRETMNRSDLVLPVSFHMKRLGLSFHINKDKFHVIPNAVNTKIFKRTRPHTTRNLFQFLTVRRLVPEKRVEDIIVAFASFTKNHKDAKLTIIGDGPERKRLESLTRELGCDEYIDFLGFVNNNELPFYYNESDVYILSSVQEGLSLTLLEAMASELPVISTNIVGNPEVIVHKKNGFLVSSKNPSDIEEGMKFFYKNRNELKSFGKASRNTILEGFTSSKVAKEILNLYKNIIKKV